MYNYVAGRVPQEMILYVTRSFTSQARDGCLALSILANVGVNNLTPQIVVCVVLRSYIIDEIIMC